MYRKLVISLRFAVIVLPIFIIFSLNLKAQNDRQLTQEAGDVRKRVALVIGNADYIKARTLANPANDATDVAQALRDVGFTVISGTDLNLKQMNDKVREFGDTLRVSGGVGLFYYAGHGIQVRSEEHTS